MAKERIVNVRFWRDNYIVSLKPDARLLFLWAITNPATELCGAYETPLPTIEAETGIKAKRLREIFAQFEADGKMLFRDGWVIVRNFAKHQHGTSTNIKAGIARTLNDCPDWVKDTVINGIGTCSHLDLDSVRQPKPEPRPKREPPLLEIFVGTVTSGIATRLGLKSLPNMREWNEQLAWAFNNGFSADDVLGCYDHLKQDKFWAKKFIPAKHLVGQVAAWKGNHNSDSAKPKRPTGRQLSAEARAKEEALL